MAHWPLVPGDLILYGELKLFKPSDRHLIWHWLPPGAVQFAFQARMLSLEIFDKSV
jgi:hypothetical protein